MVEPPKFITARHVAAVFEKMGYDPAAGTKVFGLLLELLTKDKARQQEEEQDEELLQEGIAASLAEAESAAIATGTSPPRGAAGMDGGIAGSSSDRDRAMSAEEEAADLQQARQSESASRDSFFNTPLYARKPRSSFTATLPFASTTPASSSSNYSGANAKIDVADFVR